MQLYGQISRAVYYAGCNLVFSSPSPFSDITINFSNSLLPPYTTSIPGQYPSRNMSQIMTCTCNTCNTLPDREKLNSATAGIEFADTNSDDGKAGQDLLWITTPCDRNEKETGQRETDELNQNETDGLDQTDSAELIPNIRQYYVTKELSQAICEKLGKSSIADKKLLCGTLKSLIFHFSDDSESAHRSELGNIRDGVADYLETSRDERAKIAKRIVWAESLEAVRKAREESSA